MTPAAAMYERPQVLARILASVTAERKKRRARTLKTDRTLQQLVGDLVGRKIVRLLRVELRPSTLKPLAFRLEGR